MNNSKVLSLIALFGSLKAASIVGGFTPDMMCVDVVEITEDIRNEILPDYGLMDLEMGADQPSYFENWISDDFEDYRSYGIAIPPMLVSLTPGAILEEDL